MVYVVHPHGCNCKSCQEIEEQAKENDGSNNIFSTAESWAWGKLPSRVELENFAKLVAHKQLDIFKSSTDSILFMKRVKARVYVYARFLARYSKTCFVPSQNDVKVMTDTKVTENNER